MVKKSEKNKGITLIALVVTIIVLIILASISIGTLTGKNGIIGQSKDAKEQTEIAEEKEVVSLATVKAMEKDRFGNVTRENLQENYTLIFTEEELAKMIKLLKEQETEITYILTTNNKYIDTKTSSIILKTSLYIKKEGNWKKSKLYKKDSKKWRFAKLYIKINNKWRNTV